jgi:hypothetical protein
MTTDALMSAFDALGSTGQGHKTQSSFCLAGLRFMGAIAAPLSQGIAS